MGVVRARKIDPDILSSFLCWLSAKLGMPLFDLSGLVSTLVSNIVSSDKHVEELAEEFKLFDLDGDGTISIEELELVFLSRGQQLTKDELQKTLEEHGTAGDNRIAWPKFIKSILDKGFHIPHRQNPMIADALQKSFAKFDKDGNGYIDVNELKYALSHYGYKMSEEEINTMFELVDTSHDNRIDIHEFTEFMLNR